MNIMLSMAFTQASATFLKHNALLVPELLQVIKFELRLSDCSQTGGGGPYQKKRDTKKVLTHLQEEKLEKITIFLT